MGYGAPILWDFAFRFTFAITIINNSYLAFVEPASLWNKCKRFLRVYNELKLILTKILIKRGEYLQRSVLNPTWSL